MFPKRMGVRKIHSSLRVGLLALGGLAALVTASTAQGQAVYFSEDFNSYVTDADLFGGGWTRQLASELPPTDPLFSADGPYNELGDVNNSTAHWTMQAANFVGRPIDNNGVPTVSGTVDKRGGQNPDSAPGFIISNSDSAPGNDGDNINLSYVLTSPSFDTTTGDEVWLSAAIDGVLNDGAGSSIFEIWVTPNATDPTAWVRIERRVPPGFEPDNNPLALDGVSDVCGIRGTQEYNLTNLLANRADCKVRFVHRRLSDDWFIAIDNVLIRDRSFEGSATLMPLQTFNGLSSLPTGWSTSSPNPASPFGEPVEWGPGNRPGLFVVHNGGVRLESTSFPAINRLGPNSGSDYLILDSSMDSGTDIAKEQYVQTPALAIPNGPQSGLVVVSFDSEIFRGDAVRTVELSTDGGTTWSSPIFTYDGLSGRSRSEDQAYTRHKAPGVVLDAKDVIVRFGYRIATNKSPNAAWFWGIDNVRVTFEEADVAVPDAPTFVTAPSPVSIEQASTGINYTISSFSVPGDGELTHVATQFEVWETGALSPLLAGQTTSEPLTQFSVAGLALPDSTFQIRARVVGLTSTVPPIQVPSNWSEFSPLVIGGPAGSTLVFVEDFNAGLDNLLTAVDESGIDPSLKGWNNDFTLADNPGWTVDFSCMDDFGITEWRGWTMATPAFWIAADNQSRDQFTLGTLGDGIIAIADSDEYDDGPSARFDSTLISPTFNMPNGNDAIFYLVYSTRPEDTAISEIYYSIDGAPRQSLLRLDSQNWPGADLDFVNVADRFIIPGTGSPYTLQFSFRYYGRLENLTTPIDAENCAEPNQLSDNDWWFAVDRLRVFEAGGVTNPDVDSDGDGFSDGYEIAENTNPNDPDSFPPLGDVNDDGELTAADYQAIAVAATGSTPLGTYIPARADINGDGVINAADVTRLGNFVSGKIDILR